MCNARTTLLCAALLGLAAAAHSQTPPTPAPAQGASRAASAADMPRGPGMGPGGRGRMHGRSGHDFTPGWSMMTPAERDEHHRRMQEADTPEACRAAVESHRKQMQERAKERGTGPMRTPRRDPCAGWGRG